MLVSKVIKRHCIPLTVILFLFDGRLVTVEEIHSFGERLILLSLYT